VSKKSVKEKKTLEELLEVALVSEEEQPYEVPENWVWTYLGIFCRLFNGYAYKSTDYSEIGVPLIRISDINEGDVNITDKTVRVPQKFLNEKFTIRKGDLLIAMSGSIGKVGIYNADEPALQNQRVGNIKTLFPEVLLDGYRNLFVAHSARTIQKLSYGGVVQNVSGELIEGLKLPLPPLPEQKRIVDRVESFLEKINEAKRLIEEAKETFASRRAAILAKAFRGELTKRWREVNRNEVTADLLIEKIKLEKSKTTKKKIADSVILTTGYELPYGWKWVNLSELIESSTYGTSAKTSETPSDRCKPVLRMGNIRDGQIVTENLKYLPEDHEDIDSLDLEEGDLLFNRTNSFELVGKTAVVRSEHAGKYTFASYLVRVRLVFKELLSEYVCAYINSNQGREYLLSQATQQVGQANINPTKLGTLPIPLPPVPELRVITAIIKRINTLEKQTDLDLNDEINRIQNSILQKAFCGELGTNNPEEESAIELIKETLSKQLS